MVVWGLSSVTIMVGEVEGGESTKLYIMGGLDLAPYESVAWKLWGSHIEQVLFWPVEVKSDWALIFVQAPAYTFFSTGLLWQSAPSPGFLMYRC